MRQPPSTIRTSGSAAAPFDVPSFDDGGWPGDPDPPWRFCDLRAVISVRLDEHNAFHHRLDFTDGRLWAHRPIVEPIAVDPFVYGPVAVGLTLPSYLAFRAGEVEIAEATGDGGYLIGPFPALALGEGLLERWAFRTIFRSTDRRTQTPASDFTTGAEIGCHFR